MICSWGHRVSHAIHVVSGRIIPANFTADHCQVPDPFRFTRYHIRGPIDRGVDCVEYASPEKRAPRAAYAIYDSVRKH